jgi:similar to stage IV sporulation protein
LLILLGQFVWSVEISGNSEYSNQVLSKFLAECGVAYGTWKGKIDCETLEMQLRQQFDDITWVSARLSGTRLYLTIQERLKGTTQASEDTYDAANLVADCSGVVDSIIVRTGTPLVKEGDSVSEGDLLVSGRVDILDDSKEVVSANYCAADADVWISTELSYESSFSTVYDKIEPTGKKNIMCELAFGKYVFDAGRNKCDETGWDSMTTWYPIRFGNDFYLPFQIAIIRQEQYEITSNTYTENEINAIAEEKFALYCEKLSKNTIQILSNSVMIEQNDLNVSVHGSLKALVKQQTLQEISQADMEEGTLENGINAADDGDSD